MPSERIIELAVIGGHSGRVFSSLVNSEGVPVSHHFPRACGSNLTCHKQALPFAASCATTQFVASTADRECCLSVLHRLAPPICFVREKSTHHTRLAGSVTA